MDEEAEDEEDTESPAAPSTPSDPDDSSPAYQISPSPLTGGVGLFATRAIPQGATIFSERPLFTQPAHSRTNSTIMSALSLRTREEQRQFFTLWNARKLPRPGYPALLPALGIFETNALPCGAVISSTHSEGDRRDALGAIGKSSRGAQEGIFMQASRLNHSCRPNVCRSWNIDTQEMAFRTLRDVQAGEELCMSYVDVDVLATRKQRKAELEEAFGFKCACEACTLEGEEGVDSDRRRVAVKRLYEEVGKCGKEPTLGLRKVKLALRNLKEEELVHYEASFCFDAFQFCVLVSDFTNAKAWIRKAWESSCITAGPDSPTARTFKMYWANPRAHQLAGMLPRMTLSGPD
ncbi:SET domain-containing protein [Daedaleopsis nitida]|nr:SET domain-containing protein [Daedaleopsis nitida]